MEYYNESSQRIRKELDYLMQMCDEVSFKDLCEECPMESYCLKDTSVEELWSDVSAMRIADFLYYADTCQTEEDRIALAADDARQAAIDLEITDL